jgi:hypothetical protein
MHRPHTHGGYVTIDAHENIVMHDSAEDAALHAVLHEDDMCHVYEAQFMPLLNIIEVRQRYYEALASGMPVAGA